MKVFRFAMINAGAKMNPQFWGERWNILCRSWPASPFGSCTPHLHFAVGSWKKIGIERTLVLSVEYVNLCNDVFYTFVACSVTTLRRVLYSLPKLPSGISPPQYLPTVITHSLYELSSLFYFLFSLWVLSEVISPMDYLSQHHCLTVCFWRAPSKTLEVNVSPPLIS